MQRTAIRGALCAAALLLAAGSAPAQNEIYRCQDQNGTTMLTDKPCEALQTVQATPLPTPSEKLVVKEHFTLPPAEAGRERWASKPPVSIPPKVDVATLRAARLALDLRDRVASAR
ncbi:MAG TPA: DUF4124 domain-containing protein [Pseudoduganella sp.]|jgi:hypothetical protein